MLRMLPLVALVLVLTACSAPGERMRAPDPEPTAAFASEEEALAAAVEVFARYIQIGDEIGRDGGKHADRLREVVLGEFLDQSVAGLSSWIDKGWHQVGSSTFRDPSLQQFSSDEVIVYVCHDVSSVDVLDDSGNSVVTELRADTNYLQVSFGFGEDRILRVASSQRWDERTC